MNVLVSRAVLFVASLMVTASPAGSATQGPITIASPADAVTAALARSPSPRAAEAAQQGARGDSVQAALRPNPEASLVVENFGGYGGRGAYRGATQVQSTLQLSQRIELGGKRSARIDAAGQGETLAAVQTEIARLDLARDVIVALVDAVAATRTIDIENDRGRTASDGIRVTQARVDVGKEPPQQAQRAAVEQATASLAVDRARRDASRTIRVLASLVGATDVSLAPRQRWFDDLGPEPRRPIPAEPLARLSDSPDLRKLDITIAKRRAEIAVQRSKAVPDVTVQGGMRRFHDTGETAFVAGVSIPLPISDRNQGGIIRANAELAQAEAEAERTRSELVASLVSVEQRHAIAWKAASQYRVRIVPTAEQAARATTTGYAEGKFTFLEMQEARRTLFEVRLAALEALKELHTARAELERLRGMPAGAAWTGGGR